MIKRIFLFLLTNILVVTTISILMSVLGVRPYLSASGIDYEALLVFCLIWGMAGALISLMLSRIMAKTMMGVQVIDPQNPGEFRWLVQMVDHLAKRAGLPNCPEIGVFESPEVNAFATGPTKSRSLVAFSTGLLSRMDRNQIEGVTGHELAHIANGDMVTMTLIQGVVNAFTMFIARVVAFAVSQQVREEYAHVVHLVTVIVLDIMLTILGSLVVAWFSRQREFRADRGGAEYASREKMIGALQGLQRLYQPVTDDRQAAVAALKISGRSGGLMQLFATHPPLERRIEALRRGGVA